jgi:hypothetical protein
MFDNEHIFLPEHLILDVSKLPLGLVGRWCAVCLQALPDWPGWRSTLS